MVERKVYTSGVGDERRTSVFCDREGEMQGNSVLLTIVVITQLLETICFVEGSYMA